MSTIVGTNIEVTNIKYDSDTTSMIISNAGQVTIQGEGTKTTSLQSGLAKVYCCNNGDGAIYSSQSFNVSGTCLLYTSPSPRDGLLSRMPSSA